MLACLFAGSLACTGCAGFLEGPHIRPIDRACLPAGTSPAGEVPLYRENVAALHAEVAVIDSFAADVKDAPTVQAQLEDIQCKARLAGADAVVRVRPLTHELFGFVNNPNTPFPSVMQDETKKYFFRGTAIKYQEPVTKEPARIEVTQAPLPPGAIPPPQTGRDRVIPVPFSSPLGPGPGPALSDPRTPQAPVPAPDPLGSGNQVIR